MEELLKNCTRSFLKILFVSLLTTACTQLPTPNDPSQSPTPSPTSTSSPTPTPTPSSTPSSTPIPTPTAHHPFVSALWETANPGTGSQWTQFAFDTVEQAAPVLLNGTSDVGKFCPNYSQLDTDHRASFWVYFVSAITKYESDFSPVSRMQETGLGFDPITNLPVYSEGLLQLSYQDVLVYPFCNQFDWTKDQLLDPEDPAKTILDPYKNLACGIRILNQQASKHGAVSFDSGNYWSTLMPNGKYSAVDNIVTLSQQISFCLAKKGG